MTSQIDTSLIWRYVILVSVEFYCHRIEIKNMETAIRHVAEMKQKNFKTEINTRKTNILENFKVNFFFQDQIII